MFRSLQKREIGQPILHKTLLQFVMRQKKAVEDEASMIRYAMVIHFIEHDYVVRKPYIYRLDTIRKSMIDILVERALYYSQPAFAPLITKEDSNIIIDCFRLVGPYLTRECNIVIRDIFQNIGITSCLDCILF